MDPVERSLATLERAQQVTSQRRTALAAHEALRSRQERTLSRLESVRREGEGKAAAARAELASAQDDLRRTAAALANAQSVLADRSARLNEARSKLATLMAMTRDLLRLVKPVADVRAAAVEAADGARSELESLARGHVPPVSPSLGPASPGTRLEATIMQRIRDVESRLSEVGIAADDTPAPAHILAARQAARTAAADFAAVSPPRVELAHDDIEARLKRLNADMEDVLHA